MENIESPAAMTFKQYGNEAQKSETTSTPIRKPIAAKFSQKIILVEKVSMRAPTGDI
jgi:hypothetical protein